MMGMAWLVILDTKIAFLIFTSFNAECMEHLKERMRPNSVSEVGWIISMILFSLWEALAVHFIPSFLFGAIIQTWAFTLILPFITLFFFCIMFIWTYLGCIIANWKVAQMLAMNINFSGVLLLLAGIMVPTKNMPESYQTIKKANPFWYASSAYFGFLAEESNLEFDCSKGCVVANMDQYVRQFDLYQYREPKWSFLWMAGFATVTFPGLYFALWRRTQALKPTIAKSQSKMLEDITNAQPNMETLRVNNVDLEQVWESLDQDGIEKSVIILPDSEDSVGGSVSEGVGEISVSIPPQAVDFKGQWRAFNSMMNVNSVNRPKVMRMQSAGALKVPGPMMTKPKLHRVITADSPAHVMLKKASDTGEDIRIEV